MNPTPPASSSDADLLKRKRQFVLRYGILGWGVPTGLIWALIMSWDNIPEKLPAFLLTGLIGFPLGGILFGRMLWKKQQEALAEPSKETR